MLKQLCLVTFLLHLLSSCGNSKLFTVSNPATTATLIKGQLNNNAPIGNWYHFDSEGKLSFILTYNLPHGYTKSYFSSDSKLIYIEVINGASVKSSTVYHVDNLQAQLKGKLVEETYCTACHSRYQVVVGPPYTIIFKNTSQTEFVDAVLNSKKHKNLEFLSVDNVNVIYEYLSEEFK
jgi:hypothetical protein